MSEFNTDDALQQTRIYRETLNGGWTLGKVKAAVEKYLLLPDSGLVVEILLAAVVANRMEGDPFWLFLVNPPSGVKTELIRSLNDVPDVYPLSNLTAQTLASGYESKKAEPSLLLKLDRRILTLKDFTLCSPCTETSVVRSWRNCGKFTTVIIARNLATARW